MWRCTYIHMWRCADVQAHPMCILGVNGPKTEEGCYAVDASVIDLPWHVLYLCAYTLYMDIVFLYGVEKEKG